MHNFKECNDHNDDMFSIKNVITFIFQISEMYMNEIAYYLNFYSNLTISGQLGCSVETTGGLWKLL